MFTKNIKLDKPKNLNCTKHRPRKATITKQKKENKSKMTFGSSKAFSWDEEKIAI